MLLHITISDEEDGWLVAECPALPGCVSQGRDMREAIDNIRESMNTWLWAADQKALSSIPPECHTVLIDA